MANHPNPLLEGTASPMELGVALGGLEKLARLLLERVDLVGDELQLVADDGRQHLVGLTNLPRDVYEVVRGREPRQGIRRRLPFPLVLALPVTGERIISLIHTRASSVAEARKAARTKFVGRVEREKLGTSRDVLIRFPVAWR